MSSLNPPPGRDLVEISIPFGRERETNYSRRYHWRSDQRGKDPFVILQKTIAGRGIFEIDGEAWSAPADHAFIAVVPENSAYRYPEDTTEPWTVTWINFYGRLAARLFRDFRDLHGPVIPLPRHSPADSLLQELVRSTTERPFPTLHEASIAAYTFLIEWERQLEAPFAAQTDPISIALRTCEARFREPIGIKELAAESGVTREHLTRLFTRRTGMAPGAYLRKLRVLSAQTMLAHQEIPLHEIALRSGFPSVRSLNRALTEAQGR